MPPGPFNTSDLRVVAVLNAASFSILFDTSKVEKRDAFTGTYMPSTALRTYRKNAKHLISSLITSRTASSTLLSSKRIIAEHHFEDVGCIWFNRSEAKDQEIVAKISFVNVLDWNF